MPAGLTDLVIARLDASKPKRPGECIVSVKNLAMKSLHVKENFNSLGKQECGIWNCKMQTKKEAKYCHGQQRNYRMRGIWENWNCDVRFRQDEYITVDCSQTLSLVQCMYITHIRARQAGSLYAKSFYFPAPAAQNVSFDKFHSDKLLPIRMYCKTKDEYYMQRIVMFWDMQITKAKGLSVFPEELMHRKLPAISVSSFCFVNKKWSLCVSGSSLAVGSPDGHLAFESVNCKWFTSRSKFHYT